MKALDEFRLGLSRATLVGSAILAVVLLLELSLIPFWSHISRTWLHAHPWLWRHSDDRSLLHLYFDSWFAAIITFFISLVGLGPYRRKSFIAAASNLIGFPTLFFGLLMLGTWTK